jgi:hypothetical protein
MKYPTRKTQFMMNSKILHPNPYEHLPIDEIIKQYGKLLNEL